MPSQEQTNGLNKLDKFQAQKTQVLIDLNLRLLRQKELKQQNLPSIASENTLPTPQESTLDSEELTKTTNRFGFTPEQIFGLFRRLQKTENLNEINKEITAKLPETFEVTWKRMHNRIKVNKLDFNKLENHAHKSRNAELPL